MTTAIRLYRTYILSTFVPLNTIRTVSGLLNFFRTQMLRTLVFIRSCGLLKCRFHKNTEQIISDLLCCFLFI